MSFEKADDRRNFPSLNFLWFCGFFRLRKLNFNESLTNKMSVLYRVFRAIQDSLSYGKNDNLRKPRKPQKCFTKESMVVYTVSVKYGIDFHNPGRKYHKSGEWGILLLIRNHNCSAQIHLLPCSRPYGIGSTGQRFKAH